MTAACVRFPTDPAERRRLWREFTHVDAPQAARRAPVRRAVAPTRPADHWTADAIDATPGVVGGLRSAIDAALVDGHLALGDRDRLIRRAMRLGLGRFEANLLIAAVQQRAIEAADRRPRRTWHLPARRRPWSVATLAGACVAAEATMVAAVVALLR